MGATLEWLLRFPPLVSAIERFQSMLIHAISRGPVPRHIAFIMDGNRRYARSLRIDTSEGHSVGFESLKKILAVCYQMGVSSVTVYAFSIENFKRSKYEVDALMDIAKTSLNQLCQHGCAMMDQYGCRIRILGQKDMISQDLLEACNRAEDLTRQNTKALLNVCFPYTSRAEITSALQSIVRAYENGHLDPEMIDEHTIEEHLFTQNSPPVDLLIRTSGVERLSDFLLWQVSENTTIRFIDTYWPNFTVWKFLPVVLEWQSEKISENRKWR